MAGKILIAEYDRSLRAVLRDRFEREGFDAVVAHDAPETLRQIRKAEPDVVVLDAILPALGGLEVCRQVRQDTEKASLPILILSWRGEEADKVGALELGADDYVTKPFSLNELVARVKALTRRVAPFPSTKLLRAGMIAMDLDRYIVSVEDKPTPLTSKEFHLLRALLGARGRVLSRDFLLEKIWGYERASEIESRTVDVHIGRLRQKLGSAGSSIVTVRSIGYAFDTNSSESGSVSRSHAS